MDIDIPYPSILLDDGIRIFSFTTSSYFVWKPYMSSVVQSLGYFPDFHMLDAGNFWVQEGDLCHGADFSLADMLQWLEVFDYLSLWPFAYLSQNITSTWALGDGQIVCKTTFFVTEISSCNFRQTESFPAF